MRCVVLTALLGLLLTGCRLEDDAPTDRTDSTSMIASDVAASPSPIEVEEDSLVVVMFGNSLTAGYGLANPEGQAWPSLIQERITEAGLPARVVNAGNSGETSAGGLRRIGWVLQRSKPDVFVLALGANDGLDGTDPKAMQDNLTGIFGRVREVAPHAHLVIAGMEALPNYGTDYTTRFRNVFPSVATAAGAARIPFLLQGVAGRPDLNQPDGVHPTAEGHRIMAETVWETLRPVLERAAGRDVAVR